MEYRTPLARARGLGSAHHGSAHWWHQRITALVLLPLGLWFVLCLIHLPAADFETAQGWFRHPVNGILAFGFAVTAFYHAALGIQVVIEDYVHTGWLKTFAVFGARVLLASFWLAGAFSMLQLLLRG